MNLVHSEKTCFKSFTTPDGVSLHPFYPTIWILRKPSITSITSNYSANINWLEDFDTHLENRKHCAEAAGYLETFYKFDTFWKIEFHYGWRFQHWPTRSSAKFSKGRKYYQHLERNYQSISPFKEI